VFSKKGLLLSPEGKLGLKLVNRHDRLYWNKPKGYTLWLETRIYEDKLGER
jgi:hypothetical protein